MLATLQQVTSLLQAAFKDCDVTDVKEEAGQIAGVVRWAGFEGMSPDDRNRMITDNVRRQLGAEGVNVGLLLPLTENEFNAAYTR